MLLPFLVENYAPDRAERIIIEQVHTMQQSFLMSPCLHCTQFTIGLGFTLWGKIY